MIIFVVPIERTGVYSSGTWKDWQSLKLAFEACSLPFEIVHANEGVPDDVLSRCNSGVSDLILYYSFWPGLLRAVRKSYPHIRLHVRTVNAEARQHWQRAEISVTPTYRNFYNLYGVLHVLWQDTLCRQRADTLQGISEWDNNHYWNYLPGNSSILYIPYVSPWPFMRTTVKPKPWEDREKAIVCMAGGRDPIGETMVRGFQQLAEAFTAQGNTSGWRFLVTPGVHGTDKGESLHKCVSLLPHLDEPWDTLCSVRAVAVLTPLGFGMKTTIIDALAAGCHVLVHPVLYSRLPESVRKHCISCDPNKIDDPELIHHLLEAPPRVANFNDRLLEQAAQSLRGALAAAT